MGRPGCFDRKRNKKGSNDDWTASTRSRREDRQVQLDAAAAVTDDAVAVMEKSRRQGLS
jgi:hypothetical protein